MLYKVKTAERFRSLRSSSEWRTDDDLNDRKRSAVLTF